VCASLHRNAAVFLCLLLWSVAASAQTTVQYPDRRWSTLTHSSSQWIGTPRGLYRYRAEDNVWSAWGQGNGLLSSDITALDMRGDVLWIAQGSGLTAFDQRNNTMLHFESDKSLPVTATRAMAFEEDYVWAGGSGGAARFDDLIEQWQRIGTDQGLTGDTVHAFALSDDRVFIVTGSGVNEYDPRYERWRMYPTPQEGRVLDAFNASGTLWLLRDHDLLRFDMGTRVFSPYAFSSLAGRDIRYLILQGNSFWIVTADDLWRYDAVADALHPFQEIAQLPDRELRAVALSSDGNALWFSTASGLTRYDRATGNWTYYSTAGGMPEARYDILFPTGNGIATFTDHSLIWYVAQADRWYEMPLLTETQEGHAGISLDPARGSFIDFTSDLRLDLSGSRSSWLFRNPFMAGGGAHGQSTEPVNRNDLKARMDLGSNRRLSATYNDADHEDVVYGAEYRGAREDVLQSLQWGDMRAEKAGSLLQQDFGLFGTGGRAVYGDRTEMYGRSLLELQAQGGHKTTATHTQVFQGRNRRREHTIADIDWLRNRVYALRPDRRSVPLAAVALHVYRSVAPEEELASDDLPETVIAGQRATWRPLVEGLHYHVHEGRSLLFLLPGQEVVALAVRIGRPGGTEELLLADASTGYLEMRNHYSLGGDILPASFTMRVVDVHGREQPLSIFGIDSDGDGRVDADFIDYATGMLHFPAGHPFPPAAYEQPGNVTYTMHIRYEVLSSAGYLLSRRRIIRGSESVTVDGLPVRTGEDYLLDYSAGYLLFTRDGAVLDDSRVEISYEYVRSVATERFMQANMTVSPSDFSQAVIGAGSFIGETGLTPVRFVRGGGELRVRTDDLDLRVQPEYRRTIADSASGDAAALSLSFSTDMARVSLLSSFRGDGYREPVASAYAGGRLASDHGMRGEIDISDELRAFVLYRQRSGTDDTHAIATGERSSNAGIQYARPAYPSVIARGEYLDVNDRFGTRTRRGARLDVAWTPSSALLSVGGISAARFSGYARISEETVSGGGQNGVYRSSNYFFRAAVNPRQLFSANLWYQGDMREKRTPLERFRSEYQTENINLDLLMEHITGLSVGGRFTRAVRQFPLPAVGLDRSSSSSALTNIRITPGTWLQLLQPFILYASASHTLDAYYAGGQAAAAFGLSLLSSASGQRQRASSSKVYDARLEWRPVYGLLYSLRGIWQESRSEQLDASLQQAFWIMTHSAEWRPDGRSVYAARFQYRKSSSLREERQDVDPGAWLERRFSRFLLARIALYATVLRSESPDAIHSSREIRPALTLTLTIDRASLLGRMEFRMDAGYTHGSVATRRWTGERTEYSSERLYSTLYLDMYPHPVLFLRARGFFTWRSDDLHSHAFLDPAAWLQPDVELQLVLQL
jgi:hypothetical protein